MSFDRFWEPPLPFVKDSGKNKVYQCPRCWRKNFWWHMEKQGGQCWSCHCHFSQKGLHAELGLDWETKGPQLSRPAPSASERLVVTPVVRHLQGELPSEAKAFLYGDKGLSYAEQQHFHWNGPSGCIYVGLNPRRSDGDAMAWMERGITPTSHWNYVAGDMNGYRYTKRDFYYTPNPSGGVHPTDINILVEGVFDAVRLHHCSPRVNAIACLGTKISPALLRQFIEVYPTGPTLIWFDPDRAGKDGLSSLAHSIRYALGFNPISITHTLEPADCDILQCRRVIVDKAKVLLV